MTAWWEAPCHKESGRIFFTIGNIDYLKHGGRIGKVMGIAGSALKIKPLITLKEGEIFLIRHCAEPGKIHAESN